MTAMTGANRPQPGDRVLLKGVPPELPEGLPQEDQVAIAEAVGTVVLLLQYDEDGRAELEFTDQEGVIHFIYVAPVFIDAIHPSR
jgi:hypothetical protein